MMLAADNLRMKYFPISRWSMVDEGAPRAWLGTTESMELARLGDLPRRRQWLAGRWASKLLIRSELDRCRDDERHGADSREPGRRVRLADIQVLTRDSRGRGMRPRIDVGGAELRWSLSISHSERGALVALAASNAYSLGVDLASKAAPDGMRAAHDARFLRLWFTPDERRWIAADAARRAAVLWGLKEAVYKAAHVGEGWSPREIEVRPLPDNRFACRFRDRELPSLWTDVLEIDGHIAAIACLRRSPESSARLSSAANPTTRRDGACLKGACLDGGWPNRAPRKPEFSRPVSHQASPTQQCLLALG